MSSVRSEAYGYLPQTWKFTKCSLKTCLGVVCARTVPDAEMAKKGLLSTLGSTLSRGADLNKKVLLLTVIHSLSG